MVSGKGVLRAFWLVFLTLGVLLAGTHLSFSAASDPSPTGTTSLTTGGGLSLTGAGTGILGSAASSITGSAVGGAAQGATAAATNSAASATQNNNNNEKVDTTEACSYGCGAKGCKCAVTAEQMYKIITQAFYKERDLPARTQQAKQDEQGRVNQGAHQTNVIDALASWMGSQNLANAMRQNQQQMSGTANQACANYSTTAGTSELSNNAYSNLSNDPKAETNANGKGSPNTKEPKLVTDIAATAKGTPAAISPYENAQAIVKAANDAGTCNPDSVDGKMKDFCTNSKFVGKDATLDFLVGYDDLVLPDDKKKVAMNLTRNLTAPYPSIVPLSPKAIANAALSEQDKDVQEALAHQKILESRYGVASFPFRKEISMRDTAGTYTPVEISYAANGNATTTQLNTAGSSSASQDHKRYYTTFLSSLYPNKLITVGTRTDIETAYNTGLLNSIVYQVREEQRETNKLLGAIYAELLSRRAEDLSARNAAINGRSGGGK